MSKSTDKFAPEFRERAVQMVLNHENDHPSRWAAITSIAAKIGCSGHTLLEWSKKAEVNSRKRADFTTELAHCLKALERENREPWQANEILRNASAYYAQGEAAQMMRGIIENCTFDRPFKQ